MSKFHDLSKKNRSAVSIHGKDISTDLLVTRNECKNRCGNKQVSNLRRDVPRTLVKHLWWTFSHELFSQKDGLRNFTKFTGKHLCQSISVRSKSKIDETLCHREKYWQTVWLIYTVRNVKVIEKNDFVYFIILSREILVNGNYYLCAKYFFNYPRLIYCNIFLYAKIFFNL